MGVGDCALTWQLKFGISKVTVVIDYQKPKPPPMMSSTTCATSLEKDVPSLAGPPELAEANPKHQGHRKAPSEKRRNRKRLVSYRKRKKEERRAAKLRENEMVESTDLDPGDLDKTASGSDHVVLTTFPIVHWNPAYQSGPVPVDVDTDISVSDYGCGSGGDYVPTADGGGAIPPLPELWTDSDDSSEAESEENISNIVPSMECSDNDDVTGEDIDHASQQQPMSEDQQKEAAWAARLAELEQLNQCPSPPPGLPSLPTLQRTYNYATPSLHGHRQGSYYGYAPGIPPGPAWPPGVGPPGPPSWPQ